MYKQKGLLACDSSPVLNNDTFGYNYPSKWAENAKPMYDLCIDRTSTSDLSLCFDENTVVISLIHCDRKKKRMAATFLNTADTW